MADQQKGSGKKPDTAREHAAEERERIRREEDEVTQQADESFPASDPPSFTPVKGPTGEKK